MVSDNGTGTVDLPPVGCPYLSPADFHMIVDGLPAGTTINAGASHLAFLNVDRQAGGALGGARETFDSTLALELAGTGTLDGFAKTLEIPMAVETHTGPRSPGQPVQTFDTDMFALQGAIFGDPDFDELQVTAGTNFGLPSPGSTTLTQLPDGDFSVDSFFDIEYRIDFVGAPGGALSGLSGSTTATVRVQAGTPEPPCTVTDTGGGVVVLPPEGCHYLSPADVHMIIDGLPAGTTIELDASHQRFLNINAAPDIVSGGETESFDSTLDLQIQGTGSLAGFSRHINVPVACQVQTGPRNPGDPVQTFDTEMVQLQGAIFGDPDFEELEVTAGSGFGLPSPGQTTLTKQPSGDFVVDSFFDIAYRIDFVGALGGALDGVAGSTQGTLRVRAHPFFGGGGQITTTTTTTTTTTVPAVPLDHFMGYKARAQKGSVPFVAFGPITLADQFQNSAFTVLKARSLFLPANKNNEGTNDDVTHLREYQLRPSAAFTSVSDVRIVNQCNDLLLRALRPLSLLVPSAKDLAATPNPPDPAGHSVDHFLCYQAKAMRRNSAGALLPRFPRGMQVDVVDQFQSRRYTLRKITKLCNPVDKSADPQNPPVLTGGPNRGDAKSITPATIRSPGEHLVCYLAKPSKKLIPQSGCGCDTAADPKCKGTVLTPAQIKHVPKAGVNTNNQFGPETLDTIKEFEFCIPSQKIIQ